MIRLPKSISDSMEMRMYRADVAELPNSFREFHMAMAQADIDFHLEIGDWKMLTDRGNQSDGWGSPRYCRDITVAVMVDCEWEVKTLKWHTSGAWFLNGRSRDYEVSAQAVRLTNEMFG